MTTLFKLYDNLIQLSNKTLSPLLDLAIRVYMAKIFFVSGKQKYDSYVNEGWDSVVYMFEEYHPIPGVDPNLAALGGTAGELILPALLAFGLFTRIGAAGLLIMTLTIEFLVPADYGVSNPQHYLWMLLLAVPMIKGGGALSVDHIVQKLWARKREKNPTKEIHNQETSALPEMVEKEA